MKSISELIGEAANNAPEFDPYHIDSFHAGATFATNLTFERVVEFLKDDKSGFVIGSNSAATWLVKNREKIIGDKNE